MSVDPQQVLRSFAAQVVDAVLNTLGGGAVESIFVAGGYARDEIGAFDGPEGLEIYSDLDVFVIVRGEPDLGLLRRRVRSAVAALPKTSHGNRIFAEPDVGVFSSRDFRAQKTRPGTVEIGHCYVLLHGSDEAPRWARRFVATDIDPTEGLYLLENRLGEVADVADALEREPSDGIRRYAQYVLAKSGLDAAAAVLIALGRFHPSRAERVKRFREAGSSGDGVGLLPDGAMVFVERCHRALDGFQRGSGKCLPETPFLRRETESVLLGTWKRIAGRLRPSGANSWTDLLEWRCKAGHWKTNVREISALARGLSVPRGGVLLRAARFARLSPVDSLRVSAAVNALLNGDCGLLGPAGRDRRGIESRYVPVLHGLTRGLGFGSGPVFERARRLFKETA